MPELRPLPTGLGVLAAHPRRSSEATLDGTGLPPGRAGVTVHPGDLLDADEVGILVLPT